MLKKRLNYNHLFNFYLVSKYSSLSEAARVQNVSKPNLSAQIKKLEETLAITLFSREGRGMKLTYDGQKIYDYACQMFDLSDAMLKSLATKTRTGDKTITLGITPIVSRYYSLAILAPILESKEITPIIREGNYEYLLDELLKSKLDIIINEEQIPTGDAPNIITIPVGLNSYVFVGHKKYRHLSDDFPNSLDNTNFFTYTSSNPIRAKLDQFFFNHDISTNLLGEADSIEILKEACLRGHGIAALPDLTLKDSNLDGSLYVIGAVENGDEKINATYISNVSSQKPQIILDLLIPNSSNVVVK